MGADEILGDVLLVEVDHRRDDMARRLAPDLNDVLAEVGLRHLDAGCFEMGVETDLLRHHGLALGDEASAGVLAEPEHNFARVRRGRREMHLAAAFDHFPLIGFEIKIEMRERVVLDGARLVAELVELRQLRLGSGALDDEPAFDVEKRTLQLCVGQRSCRV